MANEDVLSSIDALSAKREELGQKYANLNHKHAGHVSSSLTSCCLVRLSERNEDLAAVEV
jgi:hypothetical protein